MVKVIVRRMAGGSPTASSLRLSLNFSSNVEWI